MLCNKFGLGQEFFHVAFASTLQFVNSRHKESLKRIFDSVDDEIHDNFRHVILDVLPHNVKIALDQELDNCAFSFFRSVLREI